MFVFRAVVTSNVTSPSRAVTAKSISLASFNDVDFTVFLLVCRPLLKVVDNLLVMGLLTDTDLNHLLGLIDPSAFDPNSEGMSKSPWSQCASAHNTHVVRPELGVSRTAIMTSVTCLLASEVDIL